MHIINEKLTLIIDILYYNDLSNNYVTYIKMPERQGGVKMKKKFTKKIIIIAAAVIIAVAAIITAAVLITRGVGGSSGKAVVYADTVETVMNYGGVGSVNRYSGVVETQKSIDVKVDPEKSVKTVFVNIGDTVEEGTPLFEYDTDELSLKLESAKLELEKMQNSIKTANSQIEELEKEKKGASSEDKLSYTAEILTLQSDIQQTEYDIKVKQLEIESLNESMNNSVVKSTAAGVIKTINEKQGGDLNDTGTSDVFMTIVATGDFRIKGSIDEQNVYNIYEEMPVLVYSRVNDSVWTGVIEEIDTESNQNDNNNEYYYGNDSGESSSTYAFYIRLDSSENLLIGQHVYIEPDMGQYTPGSGISLLAGFVVQDEEEPYVWALDKNSKLEKRKVTLGEYDPVSDCYEITDGLDSDDYIAYPSEYCREGASAIKDTGKTIDESIYQRDDVNADNYYSEDDHTYNYDEVAGMLYEYDEEGNLVSACDDYGNITYFDEDGNPIEDGGDGVSDDGDNADDGIADMEVLE